ncbi:hypothetical protein Ancab_023390 [Ancistrocladus abbreviatus]
MENLSNRIKEAREALSVAQHSLHMEPTQANINIARDKVSKLKELPIADDRLLQQRVKQDCLTKGDANTSYFHALINARGA